MSKLNLLGAQRVKALEKMLDEQLSRHISELKKEARTEDALKEALDTIDEDAYISYMEDKLTINELIENLNGYAHVTGYRYYLQTGGQNNSVRGNLALKRTKGLEDEIAALRALYNDKKNRLWLCETLDEAKQIVGIE